MDKLRELSEKDRQHYKYRIYSDRLLRLVKKCSDDGAKSKATGEMYLEKDSSVVMWLVEYYCPAGRDVFQNWTPEIDELTKQIAKDVLGDYEGAE